MTKLENLSIAQNLLDRDNGHFAYLPPELLYRYNQLQRKSIGNQGDTTSPLLSLVDAVPGPISGSLIIDLEIQENSYAVDVVGKGMEVSISGGVLCSSLTG